MQKYMKAVTFSYDDGVVYDKPLIDIFNAFGMKASFNLNSGLFEGSAPWDYRMAKVWRPEPFNPALYQGHEILFHGSKHAWPTRLSPNELKAEFQDDIEALQAMFSAEIVGGAYAFGDHNEEVETYLRSIGVRFCRTVETTESFTPSENMLAYAASCHHDDDCVFPLIDRFLSMEAPETPQVFYIWGHSYEFAGNGNWDRMEEICRRLSGKADVLYGSNTEVFRYFNLI